MSAFDPADIAESRPRNHHKVEFIPAALQNVSVWGIAEMKLNRQKICPFDSKVWSSIGETFAPLSAQKQKFGAAL